MFHTVGLAKRRPPAFAPPYAVLTIHRQANTEPQRLRAIVDALASIDRRFVFPVHPRARRALADGDIALPSNVEPVTGVAVRTTAVP